MSEERREREREKSNLGAVFNLNELFLKTENCLSFLFLASPPPVLSSTRLKENNIFSVLLFAHRQCFFFFCFFLASTSHRIESLFFARTKHETTKWGKEINWTRFACGHSRRVWTLIPGFSPRYNSEDQQKETRTLVSMRSKLSDKLETFPKRFSCLVQWFSLERWTPVRWLPPWGSQLLRLSLV